MEQEEYVKTSIKIRSDLWRRAKVAAMDERSDLAAVINQALAMYFKKAGDK